MFQSLHKRTKLQRCAHSQKTVIPLRWRNMSGWARAQYRAISGSSEVQAGVSSTRSLCQQDSLGTVAGRGWNQSQSPFRVSGITNGSGSLWVPGGGCSQVWGLLESPRETDGIVSFQVPVPQRCFMDFMLEGLEYIFRVLSEFIVGPVLAGFRLGAKANSQVTSGFTAGNRVRVPITWNTGRRYSS